MSYIGSKPANKPLTSSDITDSIISLPKLTDGTDGNIISYDASGNPVAVATGNDGQVLTSAGAGAPPAFETPASSDFVKLATATTNGSTSTIEFTGLDTSIYRSYMILIQNLVFASSQNLNMQVGTSSSYLTDQDYNSTILQDNNRTDFGAASSNRGPDGMGNAFSGTMWILPAPNTDIEAAQRALYMYYQGFQRSGGDRFGFTSVEDTSLAGTAFSKFKMFGNSSGNFEAGGTVTVYGVKY